MVEVEIIEDETTSIPLSQERQLDADEIELLCQKYATRPSVKAHLESLVQKIRRDAQAVKRLEDSRAKTEQEGDKKVCSGDNDNDVKEEEGVEEVVVEEVEPSSTSTSTKLAATAKASLSSAPPTQPSATPSPPPMLSSSQKYKSIDKFAFDAGSYNSPTVTIYITSLPEIGSIVPRENITCDFTKTSFDLKIHNYKGSDYRLLKDNLDKDINPEKSKIIVKSSKIVIKLGKVKGEYGSYENWTDLTSKKTKEGKMKSKKDPSASIMDMMKEMYDSGDDNMKKVIGEAMLKQREGKMNDGPGGMGGLGDM